MAPVISEINTPQFYQEIDLEMDDLVFVENLADNRPKAIVLVVVQVAITGGGGGR
jgi:hypothetical protein